MRISGLASGMDIDSIVSDMMKIKRMPLDKLKQQKQTMEWQRDDYREMNTLLLNFRSELTQMKLSTKYRTRTTTTTDDSKVTATASSAASLSSYSIQSVSKLATAATKVSKETQIEATKALDSQTGTTNWESGNIGSEVIKVTKETNLNDLKLDLHDFKLTTLKDSPELAINIKVDGTLYKVVDDGDDLNVGEVFVDATTGKLKFADGAIKEGSTIKADYVAEPESEKFTISLEESLSLAKSFVNSGTSIKVTNEGNSIEYTIKDGEIKKGTDTVGKYDSSTGNITMNAGHEFVVGSEVEITYTQKYLDFNIKTHTSKGEMSENFFILGSDSLNNVINKVNSSNVGVSMFYDSFSGKMALTRTETGKFNKNELGDEIETTGAFIQDILQFNGGTKSGGTNAVFTINGLDTERNSNTFAVNGVTFTLKQTFSDKQGDSNYAPPVTIAINNNNDAIFENIKGFIDKYNELIAKIQEKTQQERYKSYTPLTDEQREQLSDKQQEQWEEKAKSGLLRRDQTLTSLLSSMRMDFYGKVESERINPAYSQLASIGIKTTANYLEGGKLEINEAELKKAIEEDPESIEALFNASGTTNGQKGIAQRLYDTVGRTMDILYEKAGKSYSTNNQFTIGKQLNNINDQIDSFEDRLKALEDRYYRQFTAMEKAIQNANQQSAYIMQNFSM